MVLTEGGGAIQPRFALAMVTVLWVSAIGSAFLESLPYTTTVRPPGASERERYSE